MRCCCIVVQDGLETHHSGCSNIRLRVLGVDVRVAKHQLRGFFAAIVELYVLPFRRMRWALRLPLRSAGTFYWIQPSVSRSFPLAQFLSSLRAQLRLSQFLSSLAFVVQTMKPSRYFDVNFIFVDFQAVLLRRTPYPLDPRICRFARIFGIQATRP